VRYCGGGWIRVHVAFQQLPEAQVLLTFGGDREVSLKLLSLEFGEITGYVLIDQFLFNEQKLFVSLGRTKNLLFQLRFAIGIQNAQQVASYLLFVSGEIQIVSPATGTSDLNDFRAPLISSI
jgi:hypothetical protein